MWHNLPRHRIVKYLKSSGADVKILSFPPGDIAAFSPFQERSQDVHKRGKDVVHHPRVGQIRLTRLNDPSLHPLPSPPRLL